MVERQLPKLDTRVRFPSPAGLLGRELDAGTEAHRSRSAADEKVLSATGNEEPLSRLRSVKFRERGFLRDLKIGQRPDKLISIGVAAAG